MVGGRGVKHGGAGEGSCFIQLDSKANMRGLRTL